MRPFGIEIEGFGVLVDGEIRVDRPMEWHPPGPRIMPDWSIAWDDVGGAVVTGPDRVTITGRCRGSVPPCGSQVSAKFGDHRFDCVVSESNGDQVKLVGHRATPSTSRPCPLLPDSPPTWTK